MGGLLAPTARNNHNEVDARTIIMLTKPRRVGSAWWLKAEQKSAWQMPQEHTVAVRLSVNK